MLGFGMDIQSSTSQASPFYNQNAGIFFGNAGDASADGAVSPTATATRQTSGGNNPYPESSLNTGVFGLPNSGGNMLWYIVGGLLVIGLAIFALKKL